MSNNKWGLLVRSDEYPPPDDGVVRVEAGAAYALVNGIDGRGVQPTFDLLADGEDDQGLRITTARGQIATTAGNGIRVVLDTGAGATAAAYDTPTRTLTISTVSLATALSLVKARVDALAQFGSAYFGGENGTNAADHTGGEFAGATDDRIVRLRVTAAAEGHNSDGTYMFFGNAVPANDGASRLVTQGETWKGHMPRGLRPYVKRAGTASITTVFERWVM